MEGYLIAILDDSSTPKQYWGETKFQDDITQSKIYADPKEAISIFAGLQARYNNMELKVYKCKSTIQVVPGNPFSAIDATIETPTPTPAPISDNTLVVA